MKPLLSITLFVCTAFVAFAEAPIVTTLICYGHQTNSLGGLDQIAVTNSIVIPAGQAARVATYKPATRDGFYYTKSGIRFIAELGNVVEGPAEFTMGVFGDIGLITLERWPVRRTK